jgi:hypothetical protein
MCFIALMATVTCVARGASLDLVPYDMLSRRTESLKPLWPDLFSRRHYPAFTL